jgi:YVTN family beta-propeller protein
MGVNLMKRTGLVYLLFLFSLLSNGCMPQGTMDQAPLRQRGDVTVYLQPMPQGAEKIRFIIEGITAVREGGIEIPFSLSMKEIKAVDNLDRQRVLAIGSLPPGTYTGLTIQIKSAYIQSEEGEYALLVPEGPLQVEHPFKVNDKGALTLFLTYQTGGYGGDTVVRFAPVFSLALPVGELISLKGYVTDTGANLVSVFNKKTMQVVGAFSTGNGPMGITVDKIRRKAYIAVSGDDSVEVIDLIEEETIDRLKLNFGDKPVELALTPDGRTLVVVNYDSGSASIIDAIGLFEIFRVKVGEGPTSVVMGPAGRKAYVINSITNSVSVVDLTQRTPTINIALEGEPLRGAFNRMGDRLYIISRRSPNVSVIDPSRFTVTGKIFVGTGAVSIRTDPKTGLLLVGKEAGGEIIIVDPFSSMFIDTIEIKGSAAYMAIDEETNTLFVAIPERNTVQKVNLTAKKIVGEIEVREGEFAIVLMGER